MRILSHTHTIACPPQLKHGSPNHLCSGTFTVQQTSDNHMPARSLGIHETVRIKTASRRYKAHTPHAAPSCQSAPKDLVLPKCCCVSVAALKEWFASVGPCFEAERRASPKARPPSESNALTPPHTKPVFRLPFSPPVLVTSSRPPSSSSPASRSAQTNHWLSW